MAGTITQKMQSFGSRRDGNTMYKYTLDCTADSGVGLFPYVTLGFSRQLRGCRLESMAVTPSQVTMPNKFSITLVDSRGMDLLIGAGEVLNWSIPQRAYPATDSASGVKVPTNGVVIVKIDGNSTPLANIVLDIYFSR